MAPKFLTSSLVALGIASVVSVVPGAISPSPAVAQMIDGDLSEYDSTSPYLGYGSVGSEVEDVQTFLQDQGYYEGAIDGIYGPDTYSAVTEFQTDNDLISDGIVGEETWSAFSDYDLEAEPFEDE